MNYLGVIRSIAKELVFAVFLLLSLYIIVIVVRNLQKPVLPVWLDYVAKITENQKSGKFTAKDKYETPLVLEWEKIEAGSPALPEKIKRLCEIFVQAHTPITLNFLQKCPEAVSTADDFKHLEPLFKLGIESVDWNLVEEKVKSMLRRNFINKINLNYGKKDILWIVTAKERGWNGPVGYVLFLLTPQFENGVIKVGNLMLLPIAQNRGIGKLLTSSIFKILSDVEINRIILRTVKTNEQAISAYLSYGFEKYEEKNQKVIPGSLDSYKVYFEYKTDKCNLLQEEAQKLE